MATPGDTIERAGSGGGLLAEARRRGVLRVGTSYAVIVWLLIQIADTIFERLGLPPWSVRIVIVAGAIGFPIALALSWFLELTPEGIRSDSAASADAHPPIRNWRRYADAIVIAILLGVIAALLATRPASLQQPGAIEKSLAVVPFALVGGSSGDQYLADGLADELRDQLARLPELRVAARTSSMLARSQPLDSPAIARRLGVAALVEGSVRRDADRVRVSVQLVSGRDGLVIWTERYDRQLTELLRIQEEVAQAVVRSMLPRFAGGAERAAAPPVHAASTHASYLLARHAWQKWQNQRRREFLDEAVALYRKAAAADGRDAVSRVALAEALMDTREFAPSAQASSIVAEAEALIDRALELDPNLPKAHFVRGIILRLSGRRGGLDAYRRAYELNPNDPEVFSGYEKYLFSELRYREAVELRRREITLDPLNLRSHVELGKRLADVGRSEEAISLARGLKQRLARSTEILLAEAELLSYSRAYDEAIAANLEAMSFGAAADVVFERLGQDFLLLGDSARSRRSYERVRGEGSLTPPPAYRLAQLRAGGRGMLAEGQRLQAMRPEDEFLRYSLAGAYNRAAQPRRALELLQEYGFATVATDPELRNWWKTFFGLPEMISALDALGEKTQAKELAGWLASYAAASIDGGLDFPQVRLACAIALAQLGREDEALAYLESIAERAPEAPMLDELEVRPGFGTLRDRPAFGEALQRSRARLELQRRRLPETLRRRGVALPAEIAGS